MAPIYRIGDIVQDTAHPKAPPRVYLGHNEKNLHFFSYPGGMNSTTPRDCRTLVLVGRVDMSEIAKAVEAAKEMNNGN